MQPRRRLAEVKLAGARAIVRAVAHMVVALAAAVAALGYVLPAHRLKGEAAFHSNLDDGGPVTLVACAVVIGAWWLTRRRGHGAGYLLGIAGAGGAIGAVAPVFLVHLFSTVETAAGEHVYALGVIGMFVAGAALLVLEPILYYGQRRQLERDVDPQFPVARVVATPR